MLSRQKNAESNTSRFGDGQGHIEAKRDRDLFVHVDLDDLWAIAECYGIEPSSRERHLVYEDGMPRLLNLFDEVKIKATLFVCGKDLEHQSKIDVLREALHRGHRIANHGWSHNLSFRTLPSEQMEEEIVRCHRLAEEVLGVGLRGFRAPGYGWSRKLLTLLAKFGYFYDSSLMPSPFGGFFRLFDARLTKLLGGKSFEKTQYPTLGDALHSLAPFPFYPTDGPCIWELPVGATPWLRLPCQASVCLQLGLPYFRFVESFVTLSHISPFVFLLHGADSTDFSRVSIPGFRRLRYFQIPVAERVEMLRTFLQSLVRQRCVRTSEEWFEAR